MTKTEYTDEDMQQAIMVGQVATLVTTRGIFLNLYGENEDDPNFVAFSRGLSDTIEYATKRLTPASRDAVKAILDEVTG